MSSPPFRLRSRSCRAARCLWSSKAIGVARLGLLPVVAGATLLLRAGVAAAQVSPEDETPQTPVPTTGPNTANTDVEQGLTDPQEDTQAAEQASSAPEDASGVPQVSPGEEQARRLFQEGEAAAADGDFPTAFFAFERSYELLPHPGTLRNLALCQEQAGRLADAYHSWRVLLDRFGDVVSDAARQEAEQRAAPLAPRLATVDVTTAPDGATLLVDGREVGVSPFAEPVRLDPGPHTFEARLEGYADAQADVLLQAGDNPLIPLVMTELEKPLPGLAIESRTAGATAAVDGGTPQTLPLSLQIEPGPHEILVEASDFQSQTRSVAVPQSGQVVVSVDLLPAPQPPPTEEEAGFWAGPWPWVIGGVIVAGAAATAATVVLWPEEQQSSNWTLRGR